MKKLSIEEKALRYDEAIKRGLDYIRHTPATEMVTRQDVFEAIFPEFKDSGDERIRKNLIGYIKGISKNEVCEETKDSWIAWLEKQGKKDEEILVLKDQIESLHAAIKAIKNAHKTELERQSEQKDILEGAILDSNEDGLIAETIRTKQDEQKLPIMKSIVESLGFTTQEECDRYNQMVTNLIMSDDKVEPKFKRGDWIIFNGLTLYVKEVVKGFYRTVSKGGIPNSYDWGIDYLARLWTIKDAKDGDVLVDEEINVIGIFDDTEGMCWYSKFYYSNITKEFYGIGCGGSHLKKFAKPATKEQCDTLMKAMVDEGYTFDFEKKELRKIKHNSAWSEEDESRITAICTYLQDYARLSGSESRTIRINEYCDWLKSLKDRTQPQPKQKWKQENTSDLTDFENAMMHIGGSFFGQHGGLDPNDTNAIKEQAKLLLELAPKQEWNKEDEDILNTIINHFEIDLECTENDDIIKWLKSLRPQNKWKPSDEQIYWLKWAIGGMPDTEKANEAEAVLKELLEELEKLL